MEKIFYTHQDLMDLLNVSRTKAYEIIRQLNEELRKDGYIVPKPGQVQKAYADKRLRLVEENVQ